MTSSDPISALTRSQARAAERTAADLPALYQGDEPPAPPREQPKARKHRGIRSTAAILTVTAVLTSGVLVASGAVALDAARKDVTVDYDGATVQVSSYAGTIDELLAQNGIVLGEHDVVAPSADQPIPDGGEIVIRTGRQLAAEVNGQPVTVWTTALTADEAVADMQRRDEQATLVASRSAADGRATLGLGIETDTPVTITVDGATTTQPAEADSVEGVLAARGITVADQDQVTYGVADDGSFSVDIVRVTTGTRDVTAEIPFEAVEQNDDSMYVGTTEVSQEGVPGVHTTTYATTLENGVEVRRALVSSTVTTEPVQQITLVGTKEKPQPKSPTTPTPKPSATNPGTTPTAPPEQSTPPAPIADGDPRAIGHEMTIARGYSEDEWVCLEKLWTKESGWRVNASNPSGAYGIPQALPGSKMASAGSDWKTNAATQITWGFGYIEGRYGTPCGAWSAFQSKGWY